jgi:hypothetical protein
MRRHEAYAIKNTIRLLVICVLILWPGISQAQQRYDDNWKTKLTCPAKGKTEGYSWQFMSVVENSKYRGEHGTAGEPGYLLIEGRIAEDGHAKLSANGIVASRKYARGVFTTKGDEYSYSIKAQFGETEGTGIKGEGLGIVGRECTFEFVKQLTTSPPAGAAAQPAPIPTTDNRR